MALVSRRAFGQIGPRGRTRGSHDGLVRNVDMIKRRPLVQRAETLVTFAFLAAGLATGDARAEESAILPSVPQDPRALDLPLSARRVCASSVSRRIPGKQTRERTLGEVDTGEKAKSPGHKPTKGNPAGPVGLALSPPWPVGALPSPHGPKSIHPRRDGGRNGRSRLRERLPMKRDLRFPIYPRAAATKRVRGALAALVFFLVALLLPPRAQAAILSIAPRDSSYDDRFQDRAEWKQWTEEENRHYQEQHVLMWFQGEAYRKPYADAMARWG